MSLTLARYRYCPPTAADFPTLVTTNSESQAPIIQNTTGRGLNLQFGNNPASGFNIRGCFKNLNAASNQSIIARFEWPSWGFNYLGMGLAITDGTKFVTWAMGWGQNQPYYAADYWANSTTHTTTLYNPSSTYAGGGMEWMRMDIVGGALTNFFVGCNGVDWLELYSGSVAADITPTKVGLAFFLEKSGGNYPPTGTNLTFFNCLYYSDPDITPPV
jgi:hypothetical protein